MASLCSEGIMSTFTAEVAEKVYENDDAASTASGASSSPSSLPSSPGMSEASLPSSPMKVSDFPESLKDLPSLGSIAHFAGACSRCCFHAKGRCTNGYNCRFCHFDHEKRQRKKKIDQHVRGLPATSVHRELENQGFHNEAWTRGSWGASTPSTPSTPPYVSAPPGLELPCPTPPPLSYPVVNLPASGVPPTAPPALPAPALLGPIAETASEAPQTDAHLQISSDCAVDSATANFVEGWTVEKVLEWLTSIGLSHLSGSFEEHRITGDVLLELNSSDLEEIGILAFGDKKRVLKALAQLKAPAVQFPGPLPPPPCWQAPMLETTSPWGSCAMEPLTPPPSFDA